MENLVACDCCSLRRGLLVDVSFDTLMALVALPLIYTIDFRENGIKLCPGEKDRNYFILSPLFVLQIPKACRLWRSW